MKQVGGEIELKELDYQVFYTDSGRSSLRLFLRSCEVQHIQIPEFLCPVIIDILNQESIKFSYYQIDENLKLKPQTINDECDALYLINYFGCVHKNLDELNLKNKVVIEDSVFSLDFENTYSFPKWFGFNSFRKVSGCVEGSIVKTNLAIYSDFIENQSAEFITKRYQAKLLKYQYINGQSVSESEYLNLTAESEKLLDYQKSIHSISDRGMYQINQLFKKSDSERNSRVDNFKQLAKRITPILNSDEAPSFFLFKHQNADQLRKQLQNFKIYLPGFWPNPYHLKNELYSNLVAIPIDSRYSTEDMEIITNTIEKIKKHG